MARRQIRSLVAATHRALEEAESYFDQMTDSAKRTEAERLLEDA